MKEEAKEKIRKWIKEGVLSEYTRMDCLFMLSGSSMDISLTDALDAVDELMMDGEISI